MLPMKLKVRRITIWKVNGAYRLQAASEIAVGNLLEGRVQSMIVFGEWNLKGRVLGFYQSSNDYLDVVARRATGGDSLLVEKPTNYAAVVTPTTSLRGTIDMAREISDCLGVRFAGATRIGPMTLSAGVIEFIGDFTLDSLIDCSRVIARRPRIIEREAPEDRITEVAKAYATRSWIHYSGASSLPMIGEAKRGDYSVRIGVDLYEGKFISTARIDGNFLAAPPAEPYSTIAGIQGMPIGDQVFLALEARFSAGLELYGIEPEDITLALKRAVGLYYE